jgi:hypothetical protein
MNRDKETCERHHPIREGMAIQDPNFMTAKSTPSDV